MSWLYVEEDGIDIGREPSVVDGKIIGKYKFYEDETQTHSGIFEGVFEIYWAYYNDSIGLADIYYTAPKSNILFDGTWTSYQTGQTQKACWTDGKRGCFPADFNRSDGPDLVPNEKYRSSGWGWVIDIFSGYEERSEKAGRYFRENWHNWWK